MRASYFVACHAVMLLPFFWMQIAFCVLLVQIPSPQAASIIPEPPPKIVKRQEGARLRTRLRRVSSVRESILRGYPARYHLGGFWALDDAANPLTKLNLRQKFIAEYALENIDRLNQKTNPTAVRSDAGHAGFRARIRLEHINYVAELSQMQPEETDEEEIIYCDLTGVQGEDSKKKLNGFWNLDGTDDLESAVYSCKDFDVVLDDSDDEDDDIYFYEDIPKSISQADASHKERYFE